MATLDILDFMQLSSRTTNNVGAFDVRTSIDPKSGYGQIKRLKAVGADGKADTWDMNLYDDNFVYSWITEVAYHTPRDYKKFIGNHLNPKTGKYEDGVTMFPRYVDPVSNNSVIVTDQAYTTFRVYKNCIWDNKHNDLMAVTQVLQGPFMIDHGGNIGKQPTLVHEYFWMDGGTPACEENWYAWQFGWLRWCLKHQDSKTGLYTMSTPADKIVVHDVVLPGGAPPTNFPCF